MTTHQHRYTYRGTDNASPGMPHAPDLLFRCAGCGDLRSIPQADKAALTALPQTTITPDPDPYRYAV